MTEQDQIGQYSTDRPGGGVTWVMQSLTKAFPKSTTPPWFALSPQLAGGGRSPSIETDGITPGARQGQVGVDVSGAREGQVGVVGVDVSGVGVSGVGVDVRGIEWWGWI